ncbi:MAG: efflux RND transporter permease subunit [Cytophagales bacterium]|nr:efflux RND transporter permease subunit [Cytophagales bacterium]
MALLKFIIHRKTLISMLFLGLTMLGYISYKQLPVELFPNVELPFLIVQINTTSEVDPRYLENEGIIPLEGAISTLQGIEKVESNATGNQGMIFISFTQNTDIKYAYIKLEQKVNALKSSLPEEFIVNILRVDTEQIASQFMSLQVLGEGGVDRVRNLTDQDIVTKLNNIDGIAGVQVFGGREKTVEIILDNDACEANGITPVSIQSVLSQNSGQKTFVGHVRDGNRKLFVNVTAGLKDIKNLQNLVVSEKGPLLLSDVADVYFGVKEQTSLSRVNGKDAVSIQLSKDTQVNIIELSRRTKAAIEEINKSLARKGANIIIQSNRAELMEKNIDQLINLALAGGLLAIFILWIFLKRIRLIITIALAIPVSIFTAFNFFYAFDISINSLTLIGMALAIGMLLDNSVVVIENIYRQLGNRKSPGEAVISGTKEVSRSVTAATLTTVTVFLPFVFSSNFLVKLIGTYIGVSIVSTLLVSLVVSLVLIPMMAHSTVKRSSDLPITSFKNTSIRNRLVQRYVILLKTCLRNPALTIVGGIVLFFLTILISLLVSVKDLNEVEKRELNMYITMPQGASIENTDLIVKDIEQKILQIEEKEKVISRLNESDATINIQLQEDFESINGSSIEDLRNRLQSINNLYPELDITMDERQAIRANTGGSGASPMEGFEKLLGIGTQKESIILKGQNFELMKSLASDLNTYVKNLASVGNSNINISPDRPEAHIFFDQQLMSDQDITLANVASALNGFQKSFPSGTRFESGNEAYDITIKTDKLELDLSKSIEDLNALQVKSETGGTHELQSFSQVVFGSGISDIRRLNQEKQIEIRYNFINEVLSSKSLLEVSRLEIDQLIANLNIPSGIAIEVVHEEPVFQEFYFLIFAAIVIIFMILATVFESLYLPFVIMFSIPMAAVGAFLGLIFTGNSLFNANTLIGFLILLGVVVNNGIILIDYARILGSRGYNRYRALITAGISRIRPIFITTITTIVAMLPMAMGQAEYVTTIGVPFAVTVMGGLAFSTFLTLVYIPTLSAGLGDALQWFRRLGFWLKMLQIFAMVMIACVIYQYVDGLLWQIIGVLLTIILVPGMTFFLLNTLKQANRSIIGKDEKITIRIQSLVKVYGRDRRFMREWKAARLNYEKRGEKTTSLKSLTEKAIWQTAIIGFLIYFIYFFLDSLFWQGFFMVILFIFFIDFLQAWGQATEFRSKTKLQKAFHYLWRLCLWGIPVFNMLLLANRAENLVLIILFGILWLTGVWVYLAGKKLSGGNLNINAITGKFAGIKRAYYRFLFAIPIIGAKKQPFRALSNVTLTINHGMFGLLGPNGAGKTTLMRIICGILDQSYGKVWINGHDTNMKREELQGLIGYLPQAFGSYENMTPYDFLHYQGILKNIPDKDVREQRVQYVLNAVHMTNHQHKKIGSFSGGMKQRIGIAQILLHLPKILVVDEPTAGLDPLERIRFRNLLVALSRERIVIFSTHIIEDIASSCNQVAVLIRGKIEYLGSPSAMAELAKGVVWEFSVDPSTFEKIKEQHLIVHHMKDGDQIKIKCLADKKPHENACQATAHLEDAYLWLMREKTKIKTAHEPIESQ